MSDPRLQGFGDINKRLTSLSEHRQWPRLTFDLDTCKVVMKYLRNGKNAGGTSIEVDGEWAGYINAKTGAFAPTRKLGDMSRDVRMDLWVLMQALRDDVEDTCAKYGQDTGICAICNATLTNPVSIRRGIGPICYDNMFGG